MLQKKFTSNSLPAIYLKTGGLIVEDLQVYIACLLFMGILHLPRLDNYWSSDQIYRNFIPKVMSKNFFKMISAVLHLPISGDILWMMKKKKRTEKMMKHFRK